MSTAVTTNNIPGESDLPEVTTTSAESGLQDVSSKPILAATIAALVIMMSIQQQMTQVDSEAATQLNNEASTVVNADNASTQQMSAVISSQNTSSDSSSENTNLQEAQQVESAETAQFQAQQQFITSQATLFTNLTSGPDSNNMKTDGTVGNLILQILSKVSSLLGTYY
jgi:hypothetical protein